MLLVLILAPLASSSCVYLYNRTYGRQFDSSAFMIPHDDKVEKGGEDAHFEDER